MKTKRPIRFVSILLTLIMVIGVLPLSALSTLAAGISYADEPNWVLVGTDSSASAEENLKSLTTLLTDESGSGANYTGDTLYVRLEKDIAVDFKRVVNSFASETNGGNMNIAVVGKKVLDLNGHTVKSKMMLGDIDDEWYDPYRGTFLLVYGDLTIVDSKGGGEMKSDMQIQNVRPEEVYHYDLFHVMDGGELTVNAPGSKFTSGRSQEYYDDSDYHIRNHWYRSQSNGSPVDVHSGGKLTVAGGTFNGRGYSFDRRKHDYTRFDCAAILAEKNSTVYIIDGNFYGRGGADALNISNDADITVESGVFDVFKVDRLAEMKHDAGTMNIVDGWYGDVGLPERVKTQLALKGSAVEIVKNGHDVTGDELSDSSLVTDRSTAKITVRPTGGSNNLDSRVSIVSDNGVSSINPNTVSGSDTYVVNAEYKNPYFSRTAAEFSESNYRPRNKDIGKNSDEYYLTWTFTLRDTDGSKVADLAKVTTVGTQTSVSVDLIAEYGASKWRNLSTGDYKIRLEITECWKGDHTYKSTWRNEMGLNLSDNSLLTYLSGITDFKFDFNVVHNKDLYYGDTQYLSFELDYYTVNDLNEIRDSYNNYYGGFSIMVSYTVESYDPKGNNYVTNTDPKPIASTITAAVNDGAGPKVITANIYIPRFDDSTRKIVGYDVLTTRKNFLLLPTMSKCLDSDAETVGFHKPVSLTHTDSYVKVDTAEDVWGAPLADSGTFSWQWYSVYDHDIGADVDIHGDSSPYSKYTIAAEGNSYKISRDGTYRLAFSYVPNNGGVPEEFVSVPIDIYASNSQELKIATLSGSETVRPTLDELGRSPLRLDLGEGSWGTVESVTLSIKGRPTQVAHSSPIEGSYCFSAAAREGYYLFYLNDFPSIQDAIADGCAGGEYTFRATIQGKDIYGYKYKTSSNDLTVTFEQEAEGYGLIVNGEYLGRGWSTEEEAKAQVIPLFINSKSPEITLQVAYYPESATFDPNNSYTSYSWYDSGCPFLKRVSGGNTDTYQMTILRPGVGIMSVYHVGEWIYYKICVPVTEIQLTMPNYQNYIGTEYSAIKPVNVSLVAECGKRTSESGSYASVLLQDGYEPYFWENGTNYVSGKKVAANDLGVINYQLHLPEWQCFPVEEVREGRYMVDLGRVAVTVIRSDGTSETLSAEARNAYMNWDKDFCCSDDSYNDSTTYMGFKITEDVFVKEESATYIDLVTINTTEPGVGDPINEGIKIYRDDGFEWTQLGYTCKAGDVSTLTDVKTEKGKDIIFVYSSTVSKATVETAGEHYTNASGAKAESGKSWAYSSFLNGTYENGTYFHELSLSTNKDLGTDGKKYYFAPDVKVVLNGHILDFENLVRYDARNGTSSIGLDYFFDVGDVITVSEIDIDGIVPYQGDLPATADDATLFAKYYDGTEDSGKVEIRSIEWFVDANNNSVFDDGEGVKARFWGDGTYKPEDSTLWWDGTFLPGVEYSAKVQFGSSAAALRFASDLAVDCGGGEPVFDTATSFTVKFAGDFTIRKVSIKTAEGADAAYPSGRDPLALANASVAYNIISIGVFKQQDNPDVAADSNVHAFYAPEGNHISDTLTGGKYFYEFSISWKDTDYVLDSEATVLVNGKDYGEVFAPNRNEIIVERSKYSLYCYYCFSVPKTGADVTVNVTGASGGKVNAQKTVQLIESGYSEAAYESVIAADGTSCVISGVPDGTYKVKVMAAGYVTAETTVTINGSDATVNVTLRTVSTTAAVKGTVYSKGSAADPVTLRLTLVGKSEPSYEVVVTGNKASYSIGNVENGTYVLTATKNGHSDYSIMVTVDGTDLTQNITLSLPGSLMGDVDGDGRITNKDLLLMRRYLLMVVGESETFCFDNADLDYDGRITNKDLLKLRKIIMGVE